MNAIIFEGVAEVVTLCFLRLSMPPSGKWV